MNESACHGLRVVVVGPGGVGCYFGGMLHRAGAAVTMLGREGAISPHLQAMQRDGLLMQSTAFEERVAVDVSNDPSMAAKAQLVLFCVKSTDTESAARGIAPHLQHGTIVVDLQNGVDNPERMRAAGVDPVAAVVYVAAAVEAPGAVIHRGRGDLVLGHRQRPDDAERVARWFDTAGVPCTVSSNVERELWIKLIVNSMANAISALTDATYGELAAFPPTWQVAVEVAREGVAVAGAQGITFSFDDIVERGLQICRSVGAATSSTQQDLARRRPSEIDALNGFLTRQGAEAGIPTPTNHALWALIKLRENVR